MAFRVSSLYNNSENTPFTIDRTAIVTIAIRRRHLYGSGLLLYQIFCHLEYFILFDNLQKCLIWPYFAKFLQKWVDGVYELILRFCQFYPIFIKKMRLFWTISNTVIYLVVVGNPGSLGNPGNQDKNWHRLSVDVRLVTSLN